MQNTAQPYHPTWIRYGGAVTHTTHYWARNPLHIPYLFIYLFSLLLFIIVTIQ
jgi:hypothetical protein